MTLIMAHVLTLIKLYYNQYLFKAVILLHNKQNMKAPNAHTISHLQKSNLREFTTCSYAPKFLLM